ncbi:hypothetical protein [Lysobacter gummosus]|uniref:hypothetical protein n=1 Tax=Lysobacter gummosus TaxID=262324 RepID=UPI0036413F99
MSPRAAASSRDHAAGLGTSRIARRLHSGFALLWRSRTSRDFSAILAGRHSRELGLRFTSAEPANAGPSGKSETNCTGKRLVNNSLTNP